MTPPIPQLLPYTTLFRSGMTRQIAQQFAKRLRAMQGMATEELLDLSEILCSFSHGDPTVRALRSEEHTSELQSLTNLVCRLLLVKKKNTLNIHMSIMSLF